MHKMKGDGGEMDKKEKTPSPFETGDPGVGGENPGDNGDSIMQNGIKDSDQMVYG